MLPVMGPGSDSLWRSPLLAPPLELPLPLPPLPLPVALPRWSVRLSAWRCDCCGGRDDEAPAPELARWARAVMVVVSWSSWACMSRTCLARPSLPACSVVESTRSDLRRDACSSAAVNDSMEFA
ncbi:hypothetical protein PLESTB_001565900 [Pleodorina starrii]|uniref:Uncharacterized protein n=1 Tax=Pleodorina starrii TaxID=330485 RepID=A0A9W6BXD5_9CHLO|nr:hypothetical protein PLESTB_001565900 [Pleodorina starrii]